MTDRATDDKRRTLFRSLVIGIGGLIVLVQWISTMLKPHGDFSRHWEFGRRFVQNEFLYSDGLNIPYPPFFAMAYAPFSLLPLPIAKPLFFICGFAALIAVLWILDRLTERNIPIRKDARLWIVSAALLLTSRFVIRDFDDGGQNLILLALTWTAIYLWSRDQALPAGVSLGLAVALKCTPALFIAYFAVKRRWKIAGFALLCAGIFTLLPAIWQRSNFPIHIQTWARTVLRGISETDPSTGILGPEQLQNKSLRPALARYLMQLPDGHPGRFPGPGYIDFLRLSPPLAGRIIKIILIVGLIAIGWSFRTRQSSDSPMWMWECATVSLMTILYSPISWGQHCVAAIPAVYLTVRNLVSQPRPQRWLLWILGVVGFILIVVNRSIVGRDLSMLLESYHLVTLSMVLLAGISLYQRCRLSNRVEHTCQPA